MGQFPAPEPVGQVWLANGIYPGWQGADVSLKDPREPAPSPEEVGRGALPETLGRFRALRLLHSGVKTQYEVLGVDVEEWTTATGDGSAQYKEDGSPGQDALVPSAAYLSQDGRSVFIAVPQMKPVIQLRVGWSLATKEGLAFEQNAYTTPYELVNFNPQVEGFGAIVVDMKPRAAVAVTQAPVGVEEGQRVAQLFACVACHSTDDAGIAKAGPSWKGLYGTQQSVFAAGKTMRVVADDAYLRESILEPSAKIVAGFEKGEYAMPSYAGVLNDAQIESLILYIKTLRVDP